MAGSSERLHYVLRPAKHVERKMLRDTFQRLSEFSPLDNYRYVGFGAIYFSDFLLFHRSLGINDMTSIEADVANKARYQFNRPFRAIKMQFMSSGSALSVMSWRKRTILWLDYDEAIKALDLSDVAAYASNAPSGSVLAVSMNVHPGSLGQPSQRRDKLKERIGELKIPLGLQEKDLSHKTLPETCRRIVNAEIAATLTARNGSLPPERRLNYQQLFNFRYKDGAPMLTIGGIFYTNEERHILDRCDFGALDFIRDDIGSSDFYEIRVPNLTFKELHYLDKQLPLTGQRQLHGKCIPGEDLEAYAGIYKHFTRFAEAEM